MHIWTRGGLMNNDAPITISLKVTKQRDYTEESAFKNHNSQFVWRARRAQKSWNYLAFCCWFLKKWVIIMGLRNAKKKTPGCDEGWNSFTYLYKIVPLYIPPFLQIIRQNCLYFLCTLWALQTNSDKCIFWFKVHQSAKKFLVHSPETVPQYKSNFCSD